MATVHQTLWKLLGHKYSLKCLTHLFYFFSLISCEFKPFKYLRVYENTLLLLNVERFFSRFRNYKINRFLGENKTLV
jgi:hypothetical protein